MTTDKENRRGRGPGGLHKSTITNLEGAPSIPRFTPDMAASRAQGMLLLMVHNPASGRFRRRIFLTLGAAERAAERARERGHVAQVILGHFVVSEVV